jgi:hypothetical protein
MTKGIRAAAKSLQTSKILLSYKSQDTVCIFICALYVHLIHVTM